MTHEHEHDHEHDYITLIDEDGNEELYTILLTFHSDEFEKEYVLVYPASESIDEEGVEVSAFSYEETEDEEGGQLFPIETDEEWDMVEEVLGAFIEEEDEE
ncbi:DUF1292 domain-containing protein [Allofustis seminis]|uniref:DUF1292 domain-containing protein n=1 Tax=Allofustis seminis TaxID=166939 RepID=UPI000362D78E|nr:DUF1292 domain-containing protein [Allofustis seminis]